MKLPYLARVPGLLKKNFKEAQEDQEDVPRSRGFLTRALADAEPALLIARKVRRGERSRRISRVLVSNARRAQPTSAVTRDSQGRPFIYYDDGSLRHALGSKPRGKALKAARRAKKKGAVGGSR